MEKKPGNTPRAPDGTSPLRPTVITPRRSQSGDVGERKHVPLQGKLVPTAIPGVQRRRLQVTGAELTRIAPLASKEVVRRALTCLQELVADSVTERSAILWGHALQEEYGRSVSHMLELSNDATMVKAAGYVNRMSSILGSIDLKAIADSTPGVGHYLKRLNQRIDTPQELESARLELDQLVGLMAATMDPLLSLKAEIERQIAATDELAKEIEARALAASYLAGLPWPKKPELARIFTDRSLGLTHTVAQIHETSALRTAQAGEPLSLIAAVQNIALVTVPGWLSNLSAMTAMLRNQRPPTLTEAGELDHRLRHILQQLRS
ncbi:hypothetical protein ABIB57_001116 [Devosia sp. UYZn731]|uniref:hypothetical protein n=1 Tax=Devosia sp. UYZn731 TaxID=3156345 RepID=UPI00339B941D